MSQYEGFLEGVILKDIDEVQRHASSIRRNLALVDELQHSLPAFANKEQADTVIELGADIFVQARVRDASRVFMECGLGFFVEMSLNEASWFCDKKREFLKRLLSDWNDNLAQMEARAKLFMESLSEVQASALAGNSCR
eukprot:Polyplicarium_translucidae@DN1711_c0_g1_i2.p1